MWLSNRLASSQRSPALVFAFPGAAGCMGSPALRLHLVLYKVTFVPGERVVCSVQVRRSKQEGRKQEGLARSARAAAELNESIATMVRCWPQLYNEAGEDGRGGVAADIKQLVVTSVGQERTDTHWVRRLHRPEVPPEPSGEPRVSSKCQLALARARRWPRARRGGRVDAALLLSFSLLHAEERAHHLPHAARGAAPGHQGAARRVPPVPSQVRRRGDLSTSATAHACPHLPCRAGPPASTPEGFSGSHLRQVQV